MPFTVKPWVTHLLPHYPIGHTGQPYSLQKEMAEGKGRNTFRRQDSLEAISKAGYHSLAPGQLCTGLNLSRERTLSGTRYNIISENNLLLVILPYF